MDFQSGSLHTEFLCCLELLDLQEFEKITPPKFNSEFAPEKLPKPNRKGLSSNHPFFRGKLAVKR